MPQHRRMVSTTVYMRADQEEPLHALHEATRVPIAEYVRDGIDLLLEKHRATIDAARAELAAAAALRGETVPKP